MQLQLSVCMSSWGGAVVNFSVFPHWKLWSAYSKDLFFMVDGPLNSIQTNALIGASNII